MRNANLGGLRTPVGLSILSLAAMLAMAPLAAQAVTTAAGAAATPASRKVVADPRIVDLGAAVATDRRNVTLTLALRNQAALEAFVAGLSDPKSANYRKFITPAQFGATYGQTAASVAQAVTFLRAQGFTVNKVYSNNLLINITGTNAQLAATFGAPMHSYSLLGKTFTGPSASTVLPAQLKGIATGVSGLSTLPAFRSHAAHIPNTGLLAGDVASAKVSAPSVTTAGNPAGYYTVTDLAAKYNVNPLYQRGVTGAGRTIGIVTLAGYDQSDAFGYWDAVGLTTDPGRITDVPVDNGALPADGPGSDGAGETTLDVEQSGGVAPGAAMRVYIAPNAGSGFVDAFATALSEDLVDVISTSWGSPEIANFQSDLDAFHALFLQASSQGIPVIAAAGDAGAFDINRGYDYPDCTTLLTADSPASDPLVLAAGGTTLPNTVQHHYGPVTVPSERAWGWDYLRDYIVTYYGNSLYYHSYYTVGGGGGVSVSYGLPAFQSGVSGTLTSASGQSLFCSYAFLGIPGSGYLDIEDMPSGYAGRNLPDVSLNADPYSGYLLYFGGGWTSNEGGTSFVAPQLNGILTLISSSLPGTGRLGPINPKLYAAFKTQGYSTGSPFTPITNGDNEYYKAAAHYNPATGLGSLNVDALATALSN